MQSKNPLSTLSLIHGSLVIGLLVFSGVAYWQNPSFSATKHVNSFFIYLVPLVAAIGYFASKFIFQNRIQNIDAKDGLKDKLGSYQMASILKYALLEGPACLALFAYYLNGNALFLVIALCLVAYLITQRPSLKQFRNNMPLSLEEQKQLAA